MPFKQPRMPMQGCEREHKTGDMRAQGRDFRTGDPERGQEPRTEDQQKIEHQIQRCTARDNRARQARMAPLAIMGTIMNGRPRYQNCI